MKKLLILIIPILLSGCVTYDKCNTKFPCISKDTTITNVVRVDTILTMDPDNAFLKALLWCDSLGNVYLDSIQTLQGSRIVVSYKYTDRWLKIDCDEAKQYINYTSYNKEIYKLCHKIQLLEKQEVKEPFLHQLRVPLILILAIVLSLVAFRAIKK